MACLTTRCGSRATCRSATPTRPGHGSRAWTPKRRVSSASSASAACTTSPDPSAPDIQIKNAIMSQSALAALPVETELEPLIAPHGGTLKDLYLPYAEAQALKQRSAGLPALDLNTRQLCDLELLLNGAFSPLEGFLTERDYLRVVNELRLADGTL